MSSTLESQASDAGRRLSELRSALQQCIFGQERLIDFVLIALLARGHVLLEGLPGLGKTELVRCLSKSLKLDSKRVQFTPDLLPGDITGNPLLQETPEGRRFVFQPGPVFTNLLLADEINRASPKTQSSLLEAMQERRVTVMGQTHPLPAPFFVFATQNPIELEGTYPLPEAQLDRFLFKLEVTRNEVPVLEKIIAARAEKTEPEPPLVMDAVALSELCALVPRVFLSQPLANYIARIVDASHPGRSQASRGVRFGASPRAAIGLAAAARARALLNGRVHVGHEDVQACAPAVLGHRIVLDYQARLEGRTGPSLAADLLAEVPSHPKEMPAGLAAAKI